MAVVDVMCALYDAVTKSDEPSTGWVMGKKYSLPTDDKKIEERLRSCLWFSYRKNFRPIGSTGMTSDSGWGCTMRCGQMLLAEALSRLHLPADWSWPENSADEKYRYLLRQFADVPDSPYSIQQIAQHGVDHDKKVGEWFGPNTICHVIKSLSSYDSWSDMAVHIAMDLTFVIDEIRKTASPHKANRANDGFYHPTDASLCGASVHPASLRPSAPAQPAQQSSSSRMRPVLVLIPLRLGMDGLAKQYEEPLLACLTLPQSVGIIGGRPRHALWFVGAKDKRLLYLDPHTTQPALQSSDLHHMPDQTYHKDAAGKMRLSDLDPSVALGFFCRTEDDLDDLVTRLRRDVCSVGAVMFEVHDLRPKGLECLLTDSEIDAADLGLAVVTPDAEASQASTHFTGTLSSSSHSAGPPAVGRLAMSTSVGSSTASLSSSRGASASASASIQGTQGDALDRLCAEYDIIETSEELRIT